MLWCSITVLVAFLFRETTDNRFLQCSLLQAAGASDVNIWNWSKPVQFRYAHAHRCAFVFTYYCFPRTGRTRPLRQLEPMRFCFLLWTSNVFTLHTALIAATRKDFICNDDATAKYIYFIRLFFTKLKLCFFMQHLSNVFELYYSIFEILIISNALNMINWRR